MTCSRLAQAFRRGENRVPRMLFGLCLALMFAAAAPRARAGATVPDWTAVSAIFAERCIMCHSAHGAARGLRLDSYAAALAGGERGVVLVPGDTAASELILRLRGERVPRMPFLSRPLPPEQIDLIERWIEAGLPDS